MININQEIFNKLFKTDNNIIVADTETTGLYKINNEEIVSPDITQFAGIEYELKKDLKIDEQKEVLIIEFNGNKKRFFTNYIKKDNKYFLNDNDYIEIVNNIPVIFKNNKKELLFSDSLKLVEKDNYIETYYTDTLIDFQASAVTKIVNVEKLNELSEQKINEFIIINFNYLKNKENKDLITKWNKLIKENSNLSTFFYLFLKDFNYIDISEKDKKGNYKYNMLNKEKITKFLNNRIVGGHNFASFDYMNVLKGNGIEPKIFILDTMYFQKEVTKGNSLDINLIYYLEQDLKKLKNYSLKNRELELKIKKILEQLKKGLMVLNENILNFDEYDNEVDNKLINKKIKEIKDIIKLINNRRNAHDALLDVKLNKYVLEKKINNFFNSNIQYIEQKEIKKKKLQFKEKVEPNGLIGVMTKDTKENLTTFEEVINHCEENDFKNIIISDTSPKNYYKINKMLNNSNIKNSLSFTMKYNNQNIKIIITDKEGLMLTSLMTSEYGNLTLNDTNIKDLLDNSNTTIIFPITLINTAKKLDKRIKIGIDVFNLPNNTMLNSKYIKENGIFIINNQYAGNNKVIADVIWHGIQQNEKIDQSLLVNFVNSDNIDLQEKSLSKLTKEYLTKIYSAYPEIGKNSNKLIDNLKDKEFIEPVIYDKKNIYFTPKKLGLTNKEFKNSDEYKDWSFNFVKNNVSLTKTLSPYITILQKFIDTRTKRLFESNTNEHKLLLSKQNKIYKKIIIDYNDGKYKTIKDKFKLIDYLLKNDNNFKLYMEKGIKAYNNRVIKESNVIFDMEGKGISNGNNLYTTRMLINTMNNLLIHKKNNKLPEKFNFISKDKDKFFETDYNKIINTILNMTDEETKIVYDNISLEQEKRAVGPARGSAGGSLYTYLMDITNIDPLRFNLLFERFLNEKRISPPDIDADYPFSDNSKGLTIEKFLNIIERNNKFTNEEFAKLFSDIKLDKELYNKYLKNYKMVKKLGTEAETTGKNLFRKVLSILKVPPLKINEYSATYNDNMSIKENIKNIPDLYNVYCILKDINIEILEKVPMNVGSAASAVMLNFLSVVDNKNVVPFTKNSNGTFDNKLDVLSLATMRQILLMQNIIINDKKEIFNYILDFLNDKETLYTIQQGKTGVVFQMESSLMTNYLKELYPLDYQAMADTTAIQRPGPLEWAASPYLINRRTYFRKYFEKLIKISYHIQDEKEITNKIIEDFYKKNKDINPYISFIDKNNKRNYMITLEQFKNIMNTVPFLYSQEFIKIAGLHIQKLIDNNIDKIRSVDDLEVFKDIYINENKNDLSSVEEIYLDYLEKELIKFLNENDDIDNNTNIFKKIHKIALENTTKELRKFEEKLAEHKIFKEITDKTYNTLVYQEDIMQLVQKAAGFDEGAADILRRAISKKNYDLSSVKPQIVDNLSNQIIYLKTNKGYIFEKNNKNCLVLTGKDGKKYDLGDTYIKEEKGKFSIIFTQIPLYLNKLPEQLKNYLSNINDIETTLGKIEDIKKVKNFSRIEAIYLYDKMKSFAGYAFNKSHADAYTNITYMTAYLKTHYPNIFYNTILRIGNEKNAQNILREINIYNKKLIIPTIKDINLDNKIDIIFPISKIKGVNADIELAINYLKKNMKIDNIVTLYRNLGKKYLNKTTLNNLFKFGFFNDMFSDLKEKQLSNNIEMVIKTLDNLEKEFLEYFLDKVIEIEDKDNNETYTRNELKKLIRTYIDYKKEVFIYNIEEERNKYFEFNVLEIEKPSKKVFNFIKEFEEKYGEITKKYWNNLEDFKVTKEDFTEQFFDTIQTTLEKKYKDIEENEKNEKIKEVIETIKNNIKNDNYYNDMEKQIIFVDMLKEYNYLKNEIRVIEVPKKIVETEIRNFQKNFINLYKKIKKDNGEKINDLEFNPYWVGNKPTSLILIPNYVRPLNVKIYKNNKTITPKIKINGKYTLFTNRILPKDKEFINNYGKKTTTKAVQRFYINNNKYIDLVYQKNGIFYIGNENAETFITNDNDKYKGMPLNEYKIADSNGNINRENLNKLNLDIDIDNIELVNKEFNQIHEDLIKNNIDIETVVIMPSSAKINKEKIDWVGNNNYLKLLTNFIKQTNLKNIIPIGNEALKSIKSLNNINFSSFKTDFNYPYQFGEKLGYSIVTFVENRFIPKFEEKTNSFNSYLETLKKVLKRDIIKIENKNLFEKIHNKKKVKDKNLNNIER